jgi:hypothetical protein
LLPGKGVGIGRGAGVLIFRYKGMAEIWILQGYLSTNFGGGLSEL